MAAGGGAGASGGGPAARLVLASRSPQRRAILTQLGLSFEVIVSEATERESGPADEIAVANATAKAVTVSARVPEARVVGVDTVVALDGRIYGKPADAAEARSTLLALSGRAHTVVSGVCVVDDGRPRTALARTAVVFRRLDDALLRWYVASEEWRERAGGYAIQSRGAALVSRIEGDYSNVVGLPVPTLLDLMPGLLG